MHVETLPRDAMALAMSSTVVEMEGTTEELNGIHVVLVGDSTLDNGRYLNYANGELSVEKQLSKRCEDEGWHMTVLAQDGSMLEDVLVNQMRLIPDNATHIVMSASGNDLLALLNEMVQANFTAASMYRAIVTGLGQVADRYKDLAQALKSLGCHLACCTVYRPNFNHMFFKTLATCSLGLHNSRLKQISVDLDCSVIDLANMFDSKEDFANPLELSTRGGSKFVQNIVTFVSDHPAVTMSRYRNRPYHLKSEDDAPVVMVGPFDAPLKCCSTRLSQRKTYCDMEVSQAVEQPHQSRAEAPTNARMRFSEEQERWRHA